MSDPKALPGKSPGGDTHIGPYVRHLSKSIRIAIDEALDKEFSKAGETRLTSVQAHVMGYLNMQHELGNTVYQKDIEQVFHIQRSTATGILKLLEQRGSIRRVSEEKDARLKRIEVTEKALQVKKRVDSTIEGVEKKLVSGLTEDEIKTYIELTEKMRGNLEE
ncbi:MAG: MarR family transcriptional regulator [Clostridiales bacterium]|nr:MarR family transcriptional regulator [Clostridiales bacterium]